jgi:Ca-activated chloride channel family protein
MSFAWPAALLGLLLVPLLGALVWAEDGKRRRDAARFGTPALVAGSVPQRLGWRRFAPIGVALAALALLVVGIARPHATLSVKQQEATVMLVLDTSRSMAATDVQPSRFAAAIRAVDAFLEAVPSSYSVGIVSFSTTAQVVLRPTTDRELARDALRELRLGSGTAIGDAIARAIGTVRPALAAGSSSPPPADAVPATVLLLSDGAQTQGGITPAAAATQARRQGIPVSTVALGTRDAVVKVPLPGGLEQQVTVPPDARALRAVAQRTGGRFYEAADAARLKSVYEELGTRLGHRDSRTEVTAAFAGGGAVLLLLASGLSMLWSRRPL